MKDHFINTTSLCKSDELDRWKSSLRIKLLKTKLESDLQQRVFETRHGDTWIHRELATELTRWVKKMRPTEKSIQEQVASEYEGIMEVETPVGFIDVLTPTMVIEVKEASKWKHAVGQVLSYSVYYPDRKKCIYLFGHTDKKHIIDYVCGLHSIQVKYYTGS